MRASLSALLPTQPVQRYSFQMLQASLRTPVSPLTGYTGQSLQAKQTQWVDQTARFSAELHRAAQSLSAATQLFAKENPNGVLQQRKATSSDPERVGARILGRTGASRLTVSISSLAQEQENQGDWLPRHEQSTVSQGVNRFQIRQGEQIYTLAVDAHDSDTHEDILRRMAAAINRERIPFQAEIRTDVAQGHMQLLLRGTTTGSQSGFSLSDLEGNAVSALHLDRIIHKASDAHYSIDGSAHTSPTNTVFIGETGAVALSFRRPTSVPVQIFFEQDEQLLAKQLSLLVTKLNDLADTFASSDTQQAQSLAASWSRFIDAQRSSFSRLGIEQSASGRFTLDEQAMSTAVSEQLPAVLDTLYGPAGLISQVTKQAERLQQSSHQLLSDNIFSSHRANPYQAYRLSHLFMKQAAETGVFFNQIW